MMMNLLVDTLERALGVSVDAAHLRLRFAAPAMVGETLTAGGAPSETAGVYDVWVARSDGTKSVTGTFTPK
jgi:hypothetical protein